MELKNVSRKDTKNDSDSGKKKNTPYIVTEQAEVYELYQFYDKHNLLLIKLAENKNFVLFL